ncbi:Universal stress protein family protein [Tritonibacter multivorans]|uniref:Universal stress protein family protein n=1 Tax=Tritonibacter multivorans TaxID=928856 RepID=A0A0P1FZD0_9RHOB|nr:universal stress protein [Tritonibacter multivorans]MDA7422921.1 universal stress protein [Tritonibacter multivorans]CUH74677.1 Universal stress protein family protein [Tritonibacter multivorans]SFD75789.1 Universal stress protein family protein [Tritonibacter multivorans]
MSIKSILVAYNGSDSSDAAMRLAKLMHRKYDAHVTGLLAHQSAQSRLRQETWIPSDMKDVLGALEDKEHTRIKDAFLKVGYPEVGPDHLHWIEQFGNSDQTVADYSLMFDVTVVGRRDILVGNRRYDLHPDRIAARSGRPVIVVPRKYDVEAIHEHAVLAWDGNRAAANALWSAMSILETKQRVTIVTVDNKKVGKPLPGIDVITAIERHGVQANLITVKPSSGGAAKAILDCCEQEGAGLLVMGVRQTTSFREELFGGTGKSVLENANIPVLLAQ